MEKIAYRYRLYPTDEQKVFFLKNFGCCRFIWNHMLADKKQHYKETGKMLYNRPAQYKKEFPFLKEVDSLALTNTQLDLEEAYRRFFAKGKDFPSSNRRKHAEDLIQPTTRKVLSGSVRQVSSFRK